MGVVRFHGASEHKCNPGYFTYEEKPYHPDVMTYMREQFKAVCTRLEELSKERDANGRFMVQFVATMNEPVRHPFVAYRFTSDFAYDRYERELVRLGGSLGRGVWDPFKDSYSTAKTLLLQPPLTEPEPD